MAEFSPPVTTGKRITNLDTVRGVALLGILLMNAVSFGLPEAAYFNLAAAGSASWHDCLIGILGEIFIDQKTMALFSLLFGTGVVMFADRSESKGGSVVRLVLWRNLLLLGGGILHSLVWEGDILVVYALCSPVVLLLRKSNPAGLIITGSVLIIGSAVWAMFAQGQIPASGKGLGSYWFVDAGSISDTTGIFLLGDFFLRSLGMMLIGVALYRFGIVQGNRTPVFYRRMVFLGLGFGCPLAIAAIAWQMHRGFSADIALISGAPNTLATIPVALGYLGLVALWNQRPTTILHERVRAVGRMALTNYLAQTSLGISLLSSGLFPINASRSGIAAFVLCVWALQLLWSQAWLVRFRFGPVEWVWRCATYGRLLPLRRPL